jgi:hypothetical protein
LRALTVRVAQPLGSATAGECSPHAGGTYGWGINKDGTHLAQQESSGTSRAKGRDMKAKASKHASKCEHTCARARVCVCERVRVRAGAQPNGDAARRGPRRGREWQNFINHAKPLPNHRPTATQGSSHTKQITAQQEPGQPAERRRTT